MSLANQARNRENGKILHDIWRQETIALAQQFEPHFMLKTWEEMEEPGKDFWALVASQYEEQRKP